MKKNYWKTLSSKTLHKNSFAHVTSHEVEFPNGKKSCFLIINKKGFAAIVPKIGDKFVLIHQFRYAIKKMSIEFPAGGIDCDTPLVAAKRELEEETGFKAKKFTKLGDMYVAHATMNQKGSVFLAEGLYRGRRHLDDGEYGMTVHEYSMPQIKKLIKAGKILDATTIAALAFYEMREENKRKKIRKRV